jgi:hypothetical protein
VYDRYSDADGKFTGDIDWMQIDRALAGVSNADATRYLKEWSEEKQAAGGQVAATPAALLEHAARLAGACWAEASTLANERHAAAARYQ